MIRIMMTKLRKKPILGSHSISVNYCNILVYFRITNNKFKVALTVLSKVHIWLHYTAQYSKKVIPGQWHMGSA